MSSQDHHTHVHKKRKSLAASASQSSVQVVLHEPSTSAGPAFVNFPSVKPGPSTSFSIYTRDVESQTDLVKQQTLLAGETEDVEFFSVNRDTQHGGEAQDCQYLPALYDPSSNTLTLHPSAPMYLMALRAKRLRPKAIDAAAVAEAAAQRRELYRQQRNDLGETFGTRKAKSQIKAEERNRVDVGAMEGVRGHLMESIVAQGPKEAIVPPSDLIPVPNLTTDNPLEVYTREALIPDDEYHSISITEILSATTDPARMALLPWHRGKWLESKVRNAVTSSAGSRKQTLRYLYYISALHHLLSLAPSLGKLKPHEINAKSRGIPQQVLTGMLRRFAEASGTRYSITEKGKTMILAWICCLALNVDKGAVEVGRIAKDLSMTDTKVAAIFKSLGCAVETASTAEREKAGITLQQAQENKKAVLKAPVKFPGIKRRGPVKR